MANKLTEFPKKITMDKAVLKEVNALEGVGKGSMDYVSAFKCWISGSHFLAFRSCLCA